jgi:hypothetical protein
MLRLLWFFFAREIFSAAKCGAQHNSSFKQLTLHALTDQILCIKLSLLSGESAIISFSM